MHSVAALLTELGLLFLGLSLLGLSLGLTAFDNRVEHAIANVTIAPNVRQRQNVDEVRARGIEATMAAEDLALRR